MKLKTGDKVVVVSGSNKGKEGKITLLICKRRRSGVREVI